MKSIFSRTALALAVLPMLICSCTKTIYTTKDVLGSLTTKKAVISKFGLPTERRSEGDITEWIYDFGSVSDASSYSRARANATVTDNGNNTYGSAYGSGSTVSQFSTYNRFVKFTFDANDRVINSVWQAVDFSVKKPATGKTILYITGIVALGIGLGILASGGTD
ncbi:hypothetical protein ACI6Q2_15575 [Chitinophagaceae bacterium LWZ2-11]